MPAIPAISTRVTFAWMPGSTGDLRSPSMQEDAKARPWLWPGMTVVIRRHKEIRELYEFPT
jgi:hypothetical protein